LRSSRQRLLAFRDAVPLAFPLVRDLLLCAKHLFVAAMVAGCAQQPGQGG